ncbi:MULTISPECIES: CGNR zinc finger domain-containing protein [Streptomyces]|uniref:CGNR zinc finger domain-containing protein n=1 Tax=Streptomyces solicathayae TaxID=3081768 RepID=A0ABZ0M4D7_9ACTN|nr:CGNR zinc finger domain-containing protein [Streptomyces sp. HUAS YS2]WOX26649.1 CGNR zinc finger domain-containing protein [Streptomyces sp. HUAS YS2]
MTLRHRDGQVFRFDAGALCLELLLTGGPGPVASQYEVLDRTEGLLDWVRDCRLAPGLAPVVTAAELTAVRATRDALWRLALARAGGEPLPAADLAVLNAAAAHAPLVATVAADGTRAWAPGATGTGLLATVARDAVDLLTGPYADRIRVCGADDCALLFADTSRPGRRRWCSMDRCGNRHKVRAHRARTPTEGEK